MSDVTVAIPVRDGGQLLARSLEALARQTVAHELLVCDSGSDDGSLAVARAHGARVLEIDPVAFSHGGTRNLLMDRASGARVAMLSQDAEPADERWLERLLSGFELADDVAIVYGPYLPRRDAKPAVRWELDAWFSSLAPDGRPRVDRLRPQERAVLARELIGRRGFFTDANSCISRAAWSQIRFRDMPYGEDRVLAIEMLRAGYAKAFVPEARVWHSHRYSSLQELRRCFDEWRGLREIYGWREPASPVRAVGALRGELGSARRRARDESMPAGRRAAALVATAWRGAVRLAGALLGSHADRLPAGLRRLLSLEQRGGFAPVELDAVSAHVTKRATDG
jgi:glycosyltransferase involved in cell wall biosynthesis